MAVFKSEAQSSIEMGTFSSANRISGPPINTSENGLVLAEAELFSDLQIKGKNGKQIFDNNRLFPWLDRIVGSLLC